LPLEQPTKFTIDELDPLSPTHNEFVSQGDDHIRNIKAVLQTQFQGKNGNGLDAPVRVSAAELNTLRGIDTSQTIQDQLSSGGGGVGGDMFPVGSRMLWFNKYIPNGWKAVTGVNNCMVRVTSNPNDAGRLTDGYNPFEVSGGDIPAHDHLFTTHDGGFHGHSEIWTPPSDHEHSGLFTGANGSHLHVAKSDSQGNHNHAYTRTDVVGLQKPGGAGVSFQGVKAQSTQNTGMKGSHVHTITVWSSGEHNHTVYVGKGTGGNHSHGPFSTPGGGVHKHTGRTEISKAGAKGISTKTPTKTTTTPKHIYAVLIERVY
jgi:hypothetical protein